MSGTALTGTGRQLARTVWTPSAESVAGTSLARFARWVQDHPDIDAPDVAGYDALWRWSTEDLDGFWRAIWEFFALGAPVPPGRALVEEVMPGAVWFPDARVNVAAHVLRPREDDDAVAICTVGETGEPGRLTWAGLRRDVAALAGTLRGLGVRRGDVVAGYLPNVAETLVAFLATVSLGARCGRVSARTTPPRPRPTGSPSSSRWCWSPPTGTSSTASRATGGRPSPDWWPTCPRCAR